MSNSQNWASCYRDTPDRYRQITRKVFKQAEMRIFRAHAPAGMSYAQERVPCRYLKLRLSFDVARIEAEFNSLPRPQWIEHANTDYY